MTPGQERALRELRRLASQRGDAFLLSDEPSVVNGWLRATVSLRIGDIATSEEGLPLREREEFVLNVPPGFPFDKPSLAVTHQRFKGFPHVTWNTSLCLYQSAIEWQPSDGLYGFFDRLALWITKAAINEMDPADGPLEPPHFVTDSSELPFVVRVDAPSPPGTEWIGLALLDRFANRVEVTGWDDLSGDWPATGIPALAIFLPRPLPMEFPRSGAALFQALEAAGMEKVRFARLLAIAARLSDEGESLYLLVGLPMRRAADGSSRTHIAVWVSDAETAGYLRSTVPTNIDTDELRTLRDDLRDSLLRVFEASTIAWCPVFEDRPEIVTRRDHASPASWFAGKTITLLGCGALGSWLAEILVRAKAHTLHLVDNGQVKPGLLARQNFRADDIGSNKAEALAERLRAIDPRASVTPHAREAHRFLLAHEDIVGGSDVVFDCTASSIFHQRLELDWGRAFSSRPAIVSVVIDARARHGLAAVLPRGCPGGIWNAYICFKYQLCLEGSRSDIADAFYSSSALHHLFQPEPGCSDPTFSASTAEVTALLSTALRLSATALPSSSAATGFAFSLTDTVGDSPSPFSKVLPSFTEVIAGTYRVRIVSTVISKVRSYVRHNARIRGASYETGGLLWGFWDDAADVIWIFDASGPPPDSRHDPGHFVCGTTGTSEEHKTRVKRTYGVCGFVGHWHTHPDMPSHQSSTDMQSMAALVASLGSNQKRSIMLIFGRQRARSTAGLYVYESEQLTSTGELIAVGTNQFDLTDPVA